jgi:amino acid permease
MHLSNYSSTSFSDSAVKQSKQVEHVEITDSVTSLDPNEPDKGLKRTLKSRHLAVRITDAILVGLCSSLIFAFIDDINWRCGRSR